MLKFTESCGPYSTADLPALTQWDSVSGVTVVADGGRSGYDGDNCFELTAAANSAAVKSLTVDPDSNGIYTISVGVAVRAISVTATVRLFSIATAISRFDVVLSWEGRLTVTQTTGGVLLGTICTTEAHVAPVGDGGCYIGLQIRFVLNDATAVHLEISDQFGAMNQVGAGAVLAFLESELPSASLVLGGATGQAAATWRMCDIYLTDGLAAETPVTTPEGRLLYNDGLLGNVHIDALYPTADGVNLDVDNTPWVPSVGSSHYEMVNSHPPDDATYEEADTNQQTDAFVYQHPLAGPSFGRVGCCGCYVSVYGLKWMARLLGVGGDATVGSLVRQIVTGLWAQDLVDTGGLVVASDAAFAYYPIYMDRNPIDGTPWSMQPFVSQTPTAPGSLEFGAQQIVS